MIYLRLDRNKIQILYLKKTFMGQYEVGSYEKRFEINLLSESKYLNIDLLASAVKECLNKISKSNQGFRDKETSLILPESCFLFLRTVVPLDIAPSAINSFIQDKIKNTLLIDADSYVFDYFLREGNKDKQINVFVLDKEVLKNYQEVMSLLDIKISQILPETLVYFKLFEKTLRAEKKECIFYLHLDNQEFFGYLYDSFGLIDDKRWEFKLKNEDVLENILKLKNEEYKKAHIKLNRLVISGPDSEKIRQDTFTKDVGVWTNPLKRIISNFYQDYLKILTVSNNKLFPVLQFDACFGGFIFSQENKNFFLIKKQFIRKKISSVFEKKTILNKRDVIIFVSSFILSFLVFFVLGKLTRNINLKSIFSKNLITKIEKITPTAPPPSPTPTITISKQDLKIQVLNGTGTPGKAAEVKQILLGKGYNEILTGNAEGFDYQQTEIEAKKSKTAAVNLIKSDLREYLTSPKESGLPENDAADVVIIIGKDFK